MQTTSDKPTENRSIADEQKKGPSDETAAPAGALQKMISGSPQVRQLRAIQAAANKAAGRSGVPVQAPPPVVQRATVSGVRNDGKTAFEIGNDMHELVQGLFLANGPDGFNLYTEFQVGGGRADLVAINDEREEDGLGDCYIYVGEIKSDALVWYGPGGAHQQLAWYIQAFQNDARFYGAHVGALTFWNPPVEGVGMHTDGYNCTVFTQNRGNGLYTYTGRVQDESVKKMELSLADQDEQPPPFNEAPNSAFSY